MQPSILLVEDNPDTVEFRGNRLVEEGYAVLVARNGLEAFQMATACLPAAIVLDVNLPELNGDEVCRRLRAREATANIPVVFVTAEASHRVADLLGPNTLCLEKAIRSKTLIEALRRVLPVQ